MSPEPCLLHMLPTHNRWWDTILITFPMRLFRMDINYLLIGLSLKWVWLDPPTFFNVFFFLMVFQHAADNWCNLVCNLVDITSYIVMSWHTYLYEKQKLITGIIKVCVDFSWPPSLSYLVDSWKTGLDKLWIALWLSHEFSMFPHFNC